MATRFLEKRVRSLAGKAIRWAEGLPPVRRRIEREMNGMLGELEDKLKPYRDRVPTFRRIPESGRARDEILGDMRELAETEDVKWKEGFASGAVYHGADDHVGFLNEVYALNSQSNPLHSDLWPSASKYEAEIVSMTANMLGADTTTDEICGTLSSGGTESIFLAMKAYRDWARDEKKINRPEIVAPTTAHAAFGKAAHILGVPLISVPVGKDQRANLREMRRALGRNTMVVVGSAPAFPHGLIDPIEELSELALDRRIGFHTDACLGGFLLPWARRLGYPVPPIDFRLPGVTSISVDTHKYAYAAKGTSVVLYRGLELRRYQYFTTTEWPGGLYFSPSLAGSRPGSLSAVCWAAMLSMGEQGYMDAARRILETADKIRLGIAAMPSLRVIGDPLFVIAFASDELDIYKVMDFMAERGWSLNGLHKPPCVHICVTLRHAEKGVAERFLADLRLGVEQVKANPEKKGGMAPVYGMGARLPFRGVVSEMLKRYMDMLYRV